MKRTVILAAAMFAAVAVASTAQASQLVDRNATNATMKVSAQGEAMLTYTAAGKLKHVLAWGAMNALAPTRSRKQFAFKLDYSGGYAKYHKNAYWNDFNGACLPYDGPALAWLVVACKGADGSYWALQAWQRGLLDYGLTPSPAQAAWELRLSHWNGELPVLSITTDWSYRRYDQIFGTLTYLGVGVYGFRATAAGNPLDTFGRNVYLDTFNSAYGRGWKRDNSFLTHASKGSFCYGLYPHGSHPAGKGTKYRATIEGPGVTPDVMWQGAAPGAYDKSADATANQALVDLGDPHCRPN